MTGSAIFRRARFGRIILWAVQQGCKLGHLGVNLWSLNQFCQFDIQTGSDLTLIADHGILGGGPSISGY